MQSPTELPPPADPLGEALHLLRLTGCVYARSELTAPWGMDLPPLEGHMAFHIVTRWPLLAGDRRQRAPSARARRLGARTPWSRSTAWWTASAARASTSSTCPIERISERYEFLRYGGGGDECRLICVVVRLDHAAAERLVDALPPVLQLDAWAGGGRIVGSPTPLRFIAREAETLRPGGETVITRLADILVIQIVRHWIETTSDIDTGWLAALRDDQLGRAIAAMHREPGSDWTLESLARTAAMSRSGFAARFTEVVGEPAMRYLTRWRLVLARTALRECRRPPSASWQGASATAPRLLSAAPSNVSSAPHRVATVERSRRRSFRPSPPRLPAHSATMGRSGAWSAIFLFLAWRQELG